MKMKFLYNFVENDNKLISLNIHDVVVISDLYAKIWVRVEMSNRINNLGITHNSNSDPNHLSDLPCIGECR